MDIEKSPNGHRLLDVIRIIAFHGETGRLQMTVGSTRGVFYFKYGRLVDASIGSLTGFQAINAAVSMGDAHFTFEPSIPPPSSSAITANERTILKQFFDIETVEPECDHYVRVTEPDWEITPVPVVPLNNVEALHVSQDNPENTGAVEAQQADIEVYALPAAEAQNPSVEAIDPAEEEYAEVPVTAGFFASVSRPRAALYLAILIALTGFLAFALVTKLRDQSLRSVAKQDEQTVPKPSEPIAVSNESPTQSDSVSAEPSQPSAQGVVAQNLTGQWKLVNHVEKTAYRSFDNLELGFRLVINQTGSKFTANGEKVSENGRSLPASGRTRIQVIGSIEGDRVEATFFETGKVRKTNGRFVWRIQRNGPGLEGTFVSSAAKSSGRSAATKEL